MLAIFIERAKADGQVGGVVPHLVDGGLSILQYADDTILFMEHDLEKAQNIKLLFCAFDQLSGLKINFYKSEIFCFGEAKYFENQYIELFGCNPGAFLMRYILCQPKDQGGLGIHNLQIKNTALLSKLLYGLLKTYGTWQQMLRNKYLGTKPLVQVQWKSGDSHFWAGLMKAKRDFLSFGTFLVRTDHK